MAKNPSANAGDKRDTDLIPGLGRFPRNRKWQPTPVFLLGNFHGQRSLVGYSPWSRKESDTTEHTHVAKSTTLAAFKSRRVELIPAILPMM